MTATSRTEIKVTEIAVCSSYASFRTTAIVTCCLALKTVISTASFTNMTASVDTITVRFLLQPIIWPLTFSWEGLEFSLHGQFSFSNLACRMVTFG